MGLGKETTEESGAVRPIQLVSRARCELSRASIRVSQDYMIYRGRRIAVGDRGGESGRIEIKNRFSHAITIEYRKSIFGSAFTFCYTYHSMWRQRTQTPWAPQRAKKLKEEKKWSLL